MDKGVPLYLPSQNINKYYLLILKFRQSATLNIMFISI
jgi:hypothetical protein